MIMDRNSNENQLSINLKFKNQLHKFYHNNPNMQKYRNLKQVSKQQLLVCI